MSEIDKMTNAYLEGDFKTAFEISVKLAKKGSAEAQNLLGGMYMQGAGSVVSQDSKKAVMWTEKAAKQNSLEAQYNLGLVYCGGFLKGVKQDYKKGIKWYKLAASKGHREANTGIGICYLHGRGVKQDVEEGLKYLRIAKDLGDPQAAELLNSYEGQLNTKLWSAQKNTKAIMPVHLTGRIAEMKEIIKISKKIGVTEFLASKCKIKNSSEKKSKCSTLR